MDEFIKEQRGYLLEGPNEIRHFYVDETGLKTYGNHHVKRSLHQTREISDFEEVKKMTEHMMQHLVVFKDRIFSSDADKNQKNLQMWVDELIQLSNGLFKDFAKCHIDNNLTKYQDAADKIIQTFNAFNGDPLHFECLKQVGKGLITKDTDTYFEKKHKVELKPFLKIGKTTIVDVRAKYLDIIEQKDVKLGKKRKKISYLKEINDLLNMDFHLKKCKEMMKRYKGSNSDFYDYEYVKNCFEQLEKLERIETGEDLDQIYIFINCIAKGLFKSCKSLTQQNENLKDRKSELKENLSDLNTQYDHLKEKYDNLENDNCVALQKLERKKQVLYNKQKELVVYETQLSDVRVELNNTKHELKRTKDQMKEIESSYKVQIGQKNKTILLLEDINENNSIQNGELLRKYNDIELNQLNKAKIEVEETKKNLKAYESTLERVRKERNELKQGLKLNTDDLKNQIAIFRKDEQKWKKDEIFYQSKIQRLEMNDLSYSDLVSKQGSKIQQLSDKGKHYKRILSERNEKDQEDNYRNESSYQTQSKSIKVLKSYNMPREMKEFVKKNAISIFSNPDTENRAVELINVLEEEYTGLWNGVIAKYLHSYIRDFNSKFIELEHEGQKVFLFQGYVTIMNHSIPISVASTLMPFPYNQSTLEETKQNTT